MSEVHSQSHCYYRQTSANAHLSTTATFIRPGGQKIRILTLVKTSLQRPLSSVLKLAIGGHCRGFNCNSLAQ